MPDWCSVLVGADSAALTLTRSTRSARSAVAMVGAAVTRTAARAVAARPASPARRGLMLNMALLSLCLWVCCQHQDAKRVGRVACADPSSIDDGSARRVSFANGGAGIGQTGAGSF